MRRVVRRAAAPPGQIALFAPPPASAWRSGDRVRLRGGRQLAAPLGTEAIVTRVSAHYVYVRWDYVTAPGARRQGDGGYGADAFDWIGGAR